MDTVHNGTYLTCRRTWVGNLYDVYDIESELNDNFVYLGFPSVYGSSHGIQPDGLVAISADTKNPEVCWQIIKCMLSDDVQEIELGEHNNLYYFGMYIYYGLSGLFSFLKKQIV